jgi:predicted DCC family thiol-disulfide oxidoreductase YuxK
MRNETTIVLFDGDCALCSGLVRWLLRRRRARRFQLFPLQSPTGQQVLADSENGSSSVVAQSDGNQWQTVTVVRGNRVYVRSDAVIEIAAALGGIWRLVRIFQVVPRPIRDGLYNWIAKKRIQWFGVSKQCELPVTGPSPKYRDSENHPARYRALFRRL